MPVRSPRAPLLVALLLPLGLLACTGDGEGPDPNPSSGGSVVRADVNAHDRADLQEGGTLRQPVAAIGGSWNPLSTDGDAADLNRIREPLLPRFFSYDATGAPVPDPDYLVSATETAATPTTVVLQLNPDAVWGDGSPVDGDDLIATWRACNGSDPAFRCARTAAYRQIARVTAGADKFEVTVTFTGGYPDWTSVFAGTSVLKAESVADATTFNEGWNRLDNAWLAGPFRFDQYDADAGVLTEVPNDRWWGDPPLLAQLLWRVVPADERAAAYVGHRIDAYGPDPAGYAEVAALPDTVIRQAPGATVRELVLNTGTGPLADPVVRSSVARAIDRTALVGADLQGTAGTAPTLGSHVFLPGQPGYADHSDPVAFDLARAQADLDAAGWVRGADGFRAREGAVLEVPLLVSSSDPLAAGQARLLSAQLDAAGIRAETVDVSSAQVRARLRSRDFTVASVGRTVGRSPYPVLRTYLTGVAGNASQLASPDYDALVRQLATEPDPTRRAELANQADVLLWSAAASLPLYQRPDVVATVPTLANFGAFGLSTVDYEDVGYLR